MFDTTKIPIPCPKCGHKSEETIGRLNQNPTLTCRCGASIEVKADELRRAIEKIEQAVGKLSARHR